MLKRTFGHGDGFDAHLILREAFTAQHLWPRESILLHATLAALDSIPVVQKNPFYNHVQFLEIRRNLAKRDIPFWRRDKVTGKAESLCPFAVDKRERTKSTGRAAFKKIIQLLISFFDEFLVSFSENNQISWVQETSCPITSIILKRSKL